MENIMRRINHVLTQLSGISLGLIIVFVIVDIFGRLFSMPVSGASEMAIFSMLITVYLGISYCEERKSHVSVEAISIRLPVKLRSILSIFIYILSLVILLIIVYSTCKFAFAAFISKQAIPGTRPIKIYPVIFAIFVGFVAYFFQTFVNMMFELKTLMKHR